MNDQSKMNKRGPGQSILAAHEDEVMALRSTRPPMTYLRIAQHLKDKHGITVHFATIQHYVQLRQKWRTLGTGSVVATPHPNELKKQVVPADTEVAKPVSGDNQASPWDFLDMTKGDKILVPQRKQPNQP